MYGNDINSKIQNETNNWPFKVNVKCNTKFLMKHLWWHGFQSKCVYCTFTTRKMCTVHAIAVKRHQLSYFMDGSGI